MAFQTSLKVVVLTAGLAMLAACDTAKERAEKHYQAGMAYLEQGDVDRALVEFRNVFKLDGTHKEARQAYADAERARHNLSEAFSQYLRLNEQYPNDRDTLFALASIAAEAGDWQTAQTYADQALKQAPDDQELQAVKVAADYGRAIADNNVDVMAKVPAEARTLLKALPNNVGLHRVVIDDLIRAQNYETALTEIDATIKLVPEDRSLYALRLTVLAALGENAEVEAGLLDLVDRFPDAPEMSQALVRWYTSRHEIDKAETFLRSRLKPGAADRDQQPILELVRFLAEQRGPEDAIAALDSVIAGGATSLVYKAARAGFVFDLGQHDQAISDMMAIVKDAPPSADSRRAKIGLARMLATSGNAVGARALVEEVLSEDSGDIEALKLKASWLILDDKVGEAIAILRRAYDQNPRDASVLSLMADAYERDGNHDLMRDSLSLAVQVSNKAPDESLRFAQLLASENKLLPAEGVLIDALRLSPGNLALLLPLSDIYLKVQDWPRAEAVAAELDEQKDNPVALNAAQRLRAGIVAGQRDADQAIDYLQGLVDQGKGGIDAKISILRTYIGNGQNDKALSYAAELVAADPQNPDLRFIDGSVHALAGQPAAAEAIYRKLLDEDQGRIPVWLALARIVAENPERLPEAARIVDDALKVAPQSAELRWAKAGFLEREGDIEGAIAVYEDLYKENSANPIVANNLASLLSNARTDADSLARAEVIARRLRGSDVAAYQDTYGWIAYQRGNYDDAVTELEKAVVQLAGDPLVHYHLAQAYMKVGRKPDALAQFVAVTDQAGTSDSRVFVAESRQQIDQLKAEGVTIGN